jgi:hypothetical protein
VLEVFEWSSQFSLSLQAPQDYVHPDMRTVFFNPTAESMWRPLAVRISAFAAMLNSAVSVLAGPAQSACDERHCIVARQAEERVVGVKLGLRVGQSAHVSLAQIR